MSHARFRFADFVVSPARRQVMRAGQEVPLIPRYFDLLVLLLQRRGRVVDRREIFDSVWTDVIVSDGALSQAVRTLRRALGDDSQNPVFIRTVSRHGYRFTYADVVEEPDEDAGAVAPAPAEAPAAAFGREAALRWASGLAGAAAAGVLAGALGGMLLLVTPGSSAPASVPVVLALVGALVGGLGGAGVAAGLAAAEAMAPSRRGLALIASAAAGGAAIGFFTHHIARWTLQGLFGRDLRPVGGGWEGLVLGAAAGVAYAVATSRPGESAAAQRVRVRTGLIGAAACALAGLLATAAGANLTGVSLNALARAFQGAQFQLAPVARLLGEAELGPVTRAVLAAYEGAFFGFGLLFGFTRRMR